MAKRCEHGVWATNCPYCNPLLVADDETPVIAGTPMDRLWTQFRLLRVQEIELRKLGREASKHADNVNYELQEATRASRDAWDAVLLAVEKER